MQFTPWCDIRSPAFLLLLITASERSHDIIAKHSQHELSKRISAHSPGQNSDALSVVRLSDARGANQEFQTNWSDQDSQRKGALQAPQKNRFKHPPSIADTNPI